jgi:hypothetical protein
MQSTKSPRARQSKPSRRPKLLSDELLLVLVVGLVVGALGLWLILRVSS